MKHVTCAAFTCVLLSKQLIGALLLVLAQGSHGQEEAQRPTEFPSEAQAIAAQALKDRLSGRVFKARLHDQTGWRLQFKGDYIYLNISTGASDSGRWHTEDGQLCVEYQQRFPSGCSVIRASDSVIYLQRGSTGEVVVLSPDH